MFSARYSAAECSAAFSYSASIRASTTVALFASAVTGFKSTLLFPGAAVNLSFPQDFFDLFNAFGVGQSAQIPEFSAAEQIS